MSRKVPLSPRRVEYPRFRPRSWPSSLLAGRTNTLGRPSGSRGHGEPFCDFEAIATVTCRCSRHRQPGVGAIGKQWHEPRTLRVVKGTFGLGRGNRTGWGQGMRRHRCIRRRRWLGRPSSSKSKDATGPQQQRQVNQRHGRRRRAAQCPRWNGHADPHSSQRQHRRRNRRNRAGRRCLQRRRQHNLSETESRQSEHRKSLRRERQRRRHLQRSQPRRRNADQQPRLGQPSEQLRPARQRARLHRLSEPDGQGLCHPECRPWP